MVYVYTPNLIWICLLYYLPGMKNCNFEQILTFWGSWTQLPLLMRAIFGVLMCKILSQSVYSVALWWQNPQILPFYGLWHFVMLQLAAIWESWTWVHNYKLSPIQQCQNGLCTGEIVCTNFDVQKHDRQTDRQKPHCFLAAPAVWNLSPTKLGVVIEDLEQSTFLYLENFWGQTHSFAA